jgi:hypothetical protein
MTIIKSVTIAAALLVGGASLALAQNGPATGGEPPVAGGAAGNPANFGPPGPGAIPNDVRTGPVESAAPRAAIRSRHNMYMSATGSHHKTVRTGQQGPKQPQ